MLRYDDVFVIAWNLLCKLDDILQAFPVYYNFFYFIWNIFKLNLTTFCSSFKALFLNLLTPNWCDQAFERKSLITALKDGASFLPWTCIRATSWFYCFSWSALWERLSAAAKLRCQAKYFFPKHFLSRFTNLNQLISILKNKIRDPFCGLQSPNSNLMQYKIIELFKFHQTHF